MNLEALFLQRLSRGRAEQLSLEILNQEAEIPVLMHLYVHGNMQQQKMAGWVFAICAEKKPFLFTEYIDLLIEMMILQPDQHPSIQRNAMKGLTFLELNEDQIGRVITKSFALIEDHNQLVAAQAYAVDLIVKYSKDSEHLMQELKFLLDTLYDQRSKAFQSKAHQLKIR